MFTAEILLLPSHKNTNHRNPAKATESSGSDDPEQNSDYNPDRHLENVAVVSSGSELHPGSTEEGNNPAKAPESSGSGESSEQKIDSRKRSRRSGLRKRKQDVDCKALNVDKRRKITKKGNNPAKAPELSGSVDPEQKSDYNPDSHLENVAVVSFGSF